MKRIMSAVLVCVLSSAVLAAPFTNGSFEEYTGGSVGGHVSLPTGSTAIVGWTVLGGVDVVNAVDYIGTTWVASDGDNSLDLNGYYETGGIEQTFDTVAGQSYQVTFDMAGNPAGAPQVKDMLVTAGDFADLFSFDTTGLSYGSMGWVTKSFEFTALAGSTTLSFLSAVQGAYGPALDNVSVSAMVVPAPGALLLGTIGTGLVGWIRRRR